MTLAQPVYDYVLDSVFGVYLSAPEELIATLAEVQTSISLTEAGLEFSLPDLYRFATMQASDIGEQTYTSFRSCLYGKDTQVSLRQLGGEVVIAHNHQHVDKSIYRLQALA